MIYDILAAQGSLHLPYFSDPNRGSPLLLPMWWFKGIFMYLLFTKINRINLVGTF